MKIKPPNCSRNDCENRASHLVNGSFVCKDHGVDAVRLAKMCGGEIVVESLELEDVIPDTERAP
jgi:hypothetical protein